MAADKKQDRQHTGNPNLDRLSRLKKTKNNKIKQTIGRIPSINIILYSSSSKKCLNTGLYYPPSTLDVKL